MDGGSPRRLALVSLHDNALRDDVGRIAAAADCATDEVGVPIGRASWSRAQVVVLDAQSARAAGADRLPRRRGVVVVSAGPANVGDWESAAAVGADRVVALPAEEAILVDMLGAPPESASGDGVIVGVVGGRGGAGASTFAAALALVGTASGFRQRTLLVDGDGYGGGIDLLLGAEETRGLRWPSLVLEGGRVSAGALYGALPEVRPGLSVLACGRGDAARPPGAAAVRAVVDAGRAAAGLVIGDMPRRECDVADAFLEVADLVVLVVPAELRASVAAEAVARYIAGRNPHQGLVVRGPAPGGLRGTDIADALNMPLLAAMRPEPRLADRLERGGLRMGRRSPLRTAADAVLDAVAARSTPVGWVA